MRKTCYLSLFCLRLSLFFACFLPSSGKFVTPCKSNLPTPWTSTKNCIIGPNKLNLFFSCYFLVLQSDGTELFHFVHGCVSWADYLKNMAADGTWADHVILHAAANCFKTPIHVISSLSDRHDVNIRPDRAVDCSGRLVLGHIFEHHYVSLRPNQVKQL